MNNILFASFRLKGLDGVSLEAREWAEELSKAGARIYYYHNTDYVPESVKGGVAIENESVHFRDTVGGGLTKKALAEGGISNAETETFRIEKEKIKKHLSKALTENRIDCVIPENILSFPGNLCYSIALVEAVNSVREDGRRLCIIAHHHDFFWERKRFPLNPRPRLKKVLDGMLTGINGDVAHVVINHKQQGDLKRKYGIKSFVMPNIRDIENPPKVDEGKVREFRKFCDVGREDVLAIAPVRVVERKNLELTVELIERLGGINKNRRIKLLLTHPGGDEGDEYVKRLYQMLEEKRVDYTHPVEEIRENAVNNAMEKQAPYSLDTAYAASDIVFYTPNYRLGEDSEGFGNAAIEAVYHRKNCVITPYRVYLEDIKPTGIQFIEVKENLDETVKEIDHVLKDKVKAKQMIDKNTKTGLKHFSRRTMRKKFKEIFNSLQSF